MVDEEREEGDWQYVGTGAVDGVEVHPRVSAEKTLERFRMMTAEWWEGKSEPAE